jgi:hypothetical protein
MSITTEAKSKPAAQRADNRAKSASSPAGGEAPIAPAAEAAAAAGAGRGVDRSSRCSAFGPTPR